MSENKKTKRRGKTGRRIRKWIKRLIILIIAAAAALFGLKAYIKQQAADADTGESYTSVQVKRGAMDDTVYGTGTTSARNQPNILAESDGTLTDLRVSIGDEVKAGDILGVITNEEIDDTITDLEFAIWDLDATIADTRAGSKVYTVESPASGRIVAVYAKAGDDALAVFRREGALAIISTDGRMKVELSSNEKALGLALDERVIVKGENIEAEGTVVDLTRQGTCATITIMEDDLPMNKDFDGDRRADSILGWPVVVENTDGVVIGEGELQANKPMAVSAFGGTIRYVDAVVGETAGRSETLFRLYDLPLTLNIEELRLQREASAKELADARELRENLIIVAPCDGTIATLDVSEGDEITNGTLFGSILEGEDMNLTIAVDELDVVDVEIGQPVSITVDALSDLKLSGEVLKIAPVGTSSGGVTTYDVELAFDAAGTGVRSGMNATGEIQIAHTDDTLYVPVEALMTMNNQTYVMVADGGSMTLSDVAAQQQSGGRGQRGQRGGNMPQMGGMPGREGAPAMGSMPGGASAPDMSEAPQSDAAQEQETTFFDTLKDTVMQKGTELYAGLRAWLYEGVENPSDQQVTGSLVQVEVGMQNDDYAEILSGLSEGDTVLYTSEEETTGMFGGFGGMGGMGGMRF